MFLPTFDSQFTSKLFRTLTLALLFSGLAACGGGGGGAGPSASSPPPPPPPPPPPVTISSISISPDLAAGLAAGKTELLEATGTFSDGSTRDVTSSATWGSSDDTTIALDSNKPNLIRGLKAGSATVQATVSSVSGELTITVGAAELEGIVIALPDKTTSYATSETFQLSATATFSDNSTPDVTDSVTWSSSDTDRLTISSSGLATAVAVGDVTISANQDGVASNTLSVTVTGASLVGVEATPQSSTTIPVGTKLSFNATGRWSDDSKTDLSDKVAFASSNTTVADFAAGQVGVLEAKATGSTSITATAPGGAPVSPGVSVTVTDATLTKLELSPSITDSGLAKGQSIQFKATGTFTDASSRDLTQSVEWSTDDANVLDVSASTPGLVKALETGDATLTATATGNFKAVVEVTVGDPVLNRLELEPSAKQTLNKEETLQLGAFGIYSDDERRDITAQVTWRSSDPDTAVVSNAVADKGKVTAIAAGATVVSAVDPASNLQSLGVDIEVGETTLNQIAIEPAGSGFTIAAGKTRQLNAVGTFLDASSNTSTADLTDRVTWSSSNEDAVVVSNADGSQGLARAIAAGSAAITATDPSTSVSTANPYTITVTAASLDSIAISPDPVPDLPKRQTVQLTATGTYSDGHTENLTGSAAWTSSNDGVAGVGSNDENAGKVIGLSQGTAIITVTTGALTDTVTVQVTGPELAAITVDPPLGALDVNLDQTELQLVARPTYAGEPPSMQEITAEVIWTSADPSIAAVSNTDGKKGLVSAIGNGVVDIFATDPETGIQGSSNIAIVDSAPDFASVAELNAVINEILDQRVYVRGQIKAAGGDRWVLADVAEDGTVGATISLDREVESSLLDKPVEVLGIVSLGKLSIISIFD